MQKRSDGCGSRTGEDLLIVLEMGNFDQTSEWISMRLLCRALGVTFLDRLWRLLIENSLREEVITSRLLIICILSFDHAMMYGLERPPNDVIDAPSQSGEGRTKLSPVELALNEAE